MHTNTHNTNGQTFLPHAVMESYSGKRIKFYATPSDDELQALRALGFRRDGLGNQWFLSIKEQPQAMTPDMLPAWNEAKHSAA